MSTNWDDYNEFLKEADRDNRLGKQRFEVSEPVIEEAWPDGSPRFKVKGALIDAGNWKTDLTISPPPSLAELKEITDAGRKRGIALAIQNLKTLATSYGKELKDLKEGDVLNVETTAQESNGKKYIRVMRVLAKDALAAKTSVDPGVGF